MPQTNHAARYFARRRKRQSALVQSSPTWAALDQAPGLFAFTACTHIIAPMVDAVDRRRGEWLLAVFGQEDMLLFATVNICLTRGCCIDHASDAPALLARARGEMEKGRTACFRSPGCSVGAGIPATTATAADVRRMHPPGNH